MAFEFEKFEGVGGSYVPKISIRSNGTLGISQGALNRFKLAEGEWFAQLLYDRKNQVIGIQPVSDEGPGLIKLNKKRMEGKDGKQSINAWISAKAFFDYYGINYDKTNSYLAKWDAAAGVIYVELNPTGGNQPGSGGGAAG